MSNNFYVYQRDFYPVYEPAEGGYYVTASEIVFCEEFGDLTVAVYEMLDGIIDLIERGHKIHSGSWRIEFDVDMWDDDGNMVPDISLRLPWFRFDYNGYEGDGFEVGICMNKPEDEPYQGYC